MVAMLVEYLAGLMDSTKVELMVLEKEYKKVGWQVVDLVVKQVDLKVAQKVDQTVAMLVEYLAGLMGSMKVDCQAVEME